MLTVGVDLAAEPATTAVVPMQWAGTGAEVEALAAGADDRLLVQAIAAADKAGVDCPLGWPRPFVAFVGAHQAGSFVAPVDIAGKDWRRGLAFRETDLVTRKLTGLVPLSVAADRIGLRLGSFEQVCRRSIHSLDAVVAALNARAAALGRATAPGPEHAVAARTEGWIAVPTSDLADLIREQTG